MSSYLLRVALCLSLPLTLNAAAICTVTGTGPAFGNYNFLSAAPSVANGQLTVSCTRVGRGRSTVAPVWSASAGNSGTAAARHMLSGVNILNYNLYLDTAYTQIWGDGTGVTRTGGTSMRLRRRNPTQSVTVPIYGRAPALQNPAAGVYGDTIVVTITY